MTASYILVLDQGTSSSRAVLFSTNGQVVGIDQREFTQIYPKSGWVEHDPFEIWETQSAVMKSLLRKHGVSEHQILSIGITNQRETTVLWNRRTGAPLCNAIVWQDRRSSGLCEDIIQRGDADIIRDKTGLLIDAYFSATKIQWLLEHTPGLMDLAKKGDLCFGTIDTWLIWNLTQGKVHATDLTNASRTLLCNIHTKSWDSELLALFDIPSSILPDIRYSSGDFGYYSLNGTSIPIQAAIGDQQSALFGQGCFESGMVKNTYGTGCFLLMNTGTSPRKSQHKLLTTIACHLPEKTTYALEGSVFVAGAAIQWLRDGLGVLPNSKASERFAMESEKNDVVIVPAFTGLGAPHWDMYARGAIFGLSRDTTAADLTRATLQSIALQTADVLTAMEKDSGTIIPSLQVDGGASANNYLMQFQSDILNIPVCRPTITESTAFGAAALAGIARGVWTEKDVTEIRRIEKTFTPSMPPEKRGKLLRQWNKAIDRSKLWIEPSDR
jgi:glycerol kinase